MIRVGPPAGQPAVPEEPIAPEEMAQEPAMPEKSLYSADKALIMEAMNMIHQALMMLMEVCPPEGDDMEEEPLPEEEAPIVPEEGPVGPPEM